MNITSTGMGRRTGRPARKTGAVAGDVAAYALAGPVALGAVAECACEAELLLDKRRKNQL